MGGNQYGWAHPAVKLIFSSFHSWSGRRRKIVDGAIREYDTGGRGPLLCRPSELTESSFEVLLRAQEASARGNQSPMDWEECDYPTRPHRLTLTLLFSSWPHLLFLTMTLSFVRDWLISVFKESFLLRDYHCDVIFTLCYYKLIRRRPLSLCLIYALQIGPC